MKHPDYFVTSNGLSWKFDREEPYVRCNGTQTVLLVWQRPCKTCGGVAEAKTPSDYSQSKAFARRNCETCSKTK